MDINYLSTDVIYQVGMFIIPGFINYMLVGGSLRSKDISNQHMILCMIALGFINLPLWSIYLSIRGLDARTFMYYNYNAIDWIIKILLTPVLIAVFVNKARTSVVIHKLSKRLGIKLGHPEITAWNFCFEELGTFWVIITLKDDRTIYGHLDEGSFYSTDVDNDSEGDLYVKRLYKCTKKNEWELIKNSSGVWIRKSDIKSIEFKHD